MSSLGLDKFRTLIEISARVNTDYSDINALLVHVLESAMQLVACESSFLLLVNKADQKLRFVVTLGPDGAKLEDRSVGSNSIAAWVAANNQHLIINTNSKVSHHSDTIVSGEISSVAKTVIAVPVRDRNVCIGVIELLNKAGNDKFNDTDLNWLELLSDQAGIAYRNAALYRSSREEIKALQNSLAAGIGYHPFIAESPAARDLLRVICAAAETDSPVLLMGEQGTGKELFAEQLHLKSGNRTQAFIRINCALSGALDVLDRTSDWDSGTLFFDEIAVLSMEQQMRLFEFIQTILSEKTISPKKTTRVRLIAATGCDLEKLMEKHVFLADLYYRLSVLPVTIPPLRDRKDDIEPLASFFLNEFSLSTKKMFTGFSPAALKLLFDYYWPGNVRELKNAVERACIVGIPPVVQVQDLRFSGQGQQPQIDSARMQQIADESGTAADGERTLKNAVNQFKRAYVMRILDETSWNQTETGKILGVQRTYVSRLLNELHIRGAK